MADSNTGAYGGGPRVLQPTTKAQNNVVRTGVNLLAPRTAIGLPSLPAPVSAGRPRNDWVRKCYKAILGSNNQQCNYCPKVLSNKNITRLKEHLLNACSFLRHADAAKTAKTEKEVAEALSGQAANAD